MATSGSDFNLAALANPLGLQQQALDDLAARLGDGKVIVDPNNPFTFLLETFSVITSRLALAAEHDISALNAKRAQTSEDLYKHMSDFDYVDMFSSPASIMFKLTLDKRYLFDNAVAYNSNYLKVVIPKNTVFTVGKYMFGIYYPIEIQLNRHTGSTTVLHDISVSNPLHQLTQNVVEKVEYNYMGIDLLALRFPIYQFAQAQLEEVLPPNCGFTKKYRYIDKFYAARFFTEVNGKRIELHQTVSNSSYDPYTPTVRLALEPENNILKINIPQIYFTNGQIGPKLYVELYTCKGALDVDISTVNPDTIKVDFGLDAGVVGDYTKILFKIPTLIPAQDSKKIVGGSNGYDFEELRERVITNSFHTTALITPMDLTNYFTDLGFRVKKYLDNLTDRIYFGYRVLTDNEGSIVQATHAPVKLYPGIENNVPTIRRNMDGSLTLLPTTLYTYSTESAICTPVANEELRSLAALSREDLVDTFNNTTYTRSPFHIRLITEDRYTRATCYNLLNPELKNFVLERENDQVTAQMVSSVGNIVHLDEGTGGYLVRFAVSKSKDVEAIPESDLLVYVYTKSADGTLIGIPATYQGIQGVDAVYEFKIDTDYYITKDHTLNITSLTDEDSLWAHQVNLEADYHVVYLVKKAWFETAYTEASLYEGVPPIYQRQYLCMTRQKFTLHLGHDLEDVVYNNVDIQWGPQTYQTYQAVEYHTYAEDIYETDSSGALVYTIVDGKPQVNLLHRKGEVILDDAGNGLVKHQIGDVILDETGKPTVVTERNNIYFLHLIQVDAKLFLSEHPTQVTYRNNLATQLESYFTTLRAASDLLLEQTQLFFRPTRTLGTARYNVGNDNVINQPLDLMFKIRCHMPVRVASDANLIALVEATIIETIEAEIATGTISMTDIANTVRDKMSDYIYYIDVLGINGNTELQTMTLLDTDAQPSLSQKLILTKDGTIMISKNVTIDIVSV